jgi:hypothetical protein
VSLYAGGYYYVAKRKGLLRDLRTAASGPVSVKVAAPSSWPSSLFTRPSLVNSPDQGSGIIYALWVSMLRQGASSGAG